MDRGLCGPDFFCGTASGFALRLERAGGLQPCGLLQPLCYRQRIEVELLPPCAFIAALMEFTVVSTAKGYRELVADFASKCTRLCEPKMMRVRGAATAGHARLGAHELEMISISQPKLFAKRGDGLCGSLGNCADN